MATPCSSAAIASRLIAAPSAPITVTIDRKPGYDADDMKVETEGDRLRAIGKTLPMERVTGESIGFLRFDADGAALFRRGTRAHHAHARRAGQVVSVGHRPPVALGRGHPGGVDRGPAVGASSISLPI